jgi:hypothetical protein
MADMEAELQKYLAEQGVENLLKDIVVKLCLNKPPDVLEFVKVRAGRAGRACLRGVGWSGVRWGASGWLGLGDWLEG